MANKIYPLWAQEIMKGTANNLLNSADGATTGVFVALVDSDVRGYNAADQFFSTMASAMIGTEVELTGKTQALGVFDSSTNPTFTAVPGPTSIEALLLFRKTTGANSTWPLIAYIDTGVTGLPVTSNGGDITVTWDAAGIFNLVS